MRMDDPVGDGGTRPGSALRDADAGHAGAGARSSSRAVVLACLLVTVGAVLAIRLVTASSSAASSPRPGVTLTPAGAGAELKAMWPRREAARSGDNVATLDQLDTGAELDRDVGLIRYAQGIGLPSPWAQRPLGPSVVVVPYQTRYPISFLAFVETSGEFAPLTGARSDVGYETVLLVFTRASQSRPWRVAMETHYAGGLGFTPPPSGTYAPPINLSYAWRSPLAALDDLARFDQDAVQRRRDSSESSFVVGPWTTGANSAVANEGVDGPIDGGTIVHIHTYSVDPKLDGIYQFSAPEGINLVCGTIRVQGVVRPIRQDETLLQNSARTNWGGWLSAGQYSLIHTSELNQVCLGLSNTLYITAVSGESGLDEWNATGIPARAFGT